MMGFMFLIGFVFKGEREEKSEIGAILKPSRRSTSQGCEWWLTAHGFTPRVLPRNSATVPGESL